MPRSLPGLRCLGNRGLLSGIALLPPYFFVMNNLFAAFILILGAAAINLAFALITLLPASNEVKFVFWIAALSGIVALVVRELTRRFEF